MQMRIALFSDVHANEAALDAVLADIDRVGVDERFCAGDLVGLGPRPNAVVARIRREGVPTIRGNHEVELLKEIAGSGAGKDHILWTASVIRKRHRRWIERLPERFAVERVGARIQIVHGSPRKLEDLVFPSLTARSIEAYYPDETTRPDVLVAGHTHIPFVRRVGGVLVVNAGSAGKPVDGDPRVAWAVLEIDDGEARARIRRVAYPLERTLAEMKKVRMRKGLIRALRHSTRRWPARKEGIGR
jgi:putative phosphoesterase